MARPASGCSSPKPPCTPMVPSKRPTAIRLPGSSAATARTGLPCCTAAHRPLPPSALRGYGPGIRCCSELKLFSCTRTKLLNIFKIHIRLCAAAPTCFASESVVRDNGTPGEAELHRGTVPRAADQQRATGTTDGQPAACGGQRKHWPGMRPQHLQLVAPPRQLPWDTSDSENELRCPFGLPKRFRWDVGMAA